MCCISVLRQLCFAGPIAGVLLFTFEGLQAQQLLGDWKVVAAPGRGSPELYATDLPVWKVHDDGTNIRASHWTRRDREEREVAPLPEHLVREPLMHGYRTSLHHADGSWLIGFDGGEFGGGLWSTNDDGSQTSLVLSREDIHALYHTNDGVIVLSGVAHATIDEGKVWFVFDTSWDKAAARLLCDLHGSPDASVQDSPSTVLVVTRSAVLRIGTSGSLETLAHIPVPPPVVTSVVMAADRTIYVGVPGYILRLLPEPTGYSVQWLVPAGNAGSGKPGSSQ